MKTRKKRKIKVVKIIDAIFESLFYFGIVGIAFMLIFAPAFKPDAYYTALLVSIACALTPVFYLAIWCEWVSSKRHDRRE